MFKTRPNFKFLPATVMDHWQSAGPFKFEKALDSWEIEVGESLEIEYDGMNRYAGQTEPCQGCIRSNLTSGGVGRFMGTWGMYEGF